MNRQFSIVAKNFFSGTLLKMMLVYSIYAQDSQIKIILVAGQSNALNWHANAASLDTTNSIDELIRFYYHTGLPPARSGTPINSTSNNTWTTLSYQTQDPYILHNKDFFGPEMSLARALHSELQDIAVIKTTYAGTSLAADWKKGLNSGNQLYKLMMAQIDSATSILKRDGYSYEFEGFFWMQGESDAANSTYASNYRSNLEDFIQDLRTDLNTPDLKFILGRIGNASSYPYKELIRETQVEVATSDSLVDWVSIDGLPLDTDKVHLLADGVQELGSRMANSWLSLSGLIVGIEDVHVEYKVKLLQNYPNPFNPITTISFELPYSSEVKLSIYNPLGQEVSTILNERLTAGKHHISLDASFLSSGVYIYSLVTVDQQISKKMVLIK